MCNVDVVVIGGGAAGLMCAIEAGKRGRQVVLLEHNDRIGKKIRISGGGRCNFTNIHATHANYLSANPHFCKSAFSRYTSDDFITLVKKHNIPFHEKTLGQLFCDETAQKIISMLRKECNDVHVDIIENCTVKSVKKDAAFTVKTSKGDFIAEAVVIATGGLSIPPLGATDFGYRVAKKFGLAVTNTVPALVPLTFAKKDVDVFKQLAGISLDVEVCCGKQTFREAMLFTHRGLSGPAILQISSYWKKGEALTINLLPDISFTDWLSPFKNSKKLLSTLLSDVLSKRFVQAFTKTYLINKPVNQYSAKEIKQLSDTLNGWAVYPSGTEGYKKAEVTKGGVDTKELSSKTMEAKKVSGLYFIGEVVDMTGHLGGFNFQWAWASGYVSGQAV